MRPEELTTGFEHVSRLHSGQTPAALAQRERVFLYALVYSLSPQYTLEIGTFKGGSAYIISGALDDVATGGKLLCLEPFPDKIEVDWNLIKHNAIICKGFFPTDMPAHIDGQSTMRLFELCFLDADHSYNPVYAYCKYLRDYIKPGGYILCHDSYNDETALALKDASRDFGYVDCGMISRCCNDQDPAVKYGGFRLLLLRD